MNEEIEFPSGTVLLSGDVGSGKSSILYALDFALFGIQRTGGLAGDALLRNGSDKGRVELHFNIDGKDVIIKRNLRSGAKGATQDTGRIVVDGIEKECTALELKQNILDLLNYPRELLTKSKSLMYRYTVYTPQEEMKSILLGERDVRLEILRKVFGIDKYRRIQNNGKLFVSKMKGRKKEYGGMIYDLEDKKIEIARIFGEKEDIKNKLDSLLPLISKKEGEIKEIKDRIFALELKTKVFGEKKNELDILKATSLDVASNIGGVENDIKSLNEEILRLCKELEEKVDDVVMLEGKKKEVECVLGELSDKEKRFLVNIQELKVKREHCEKMKGDVKHLSNCPTCKQIVREDYKMEFCISQDVKIQEYNQQLVRLERDSKENKDKLEGMNSILVELQTILQKSEAYKVKKEQLKEKEVKKEELVAYLGVLNEKLEGYSVKKKELFDFLDGFGELQDEFKEVKERLDNLLVEEKELLVSRAGLTSSLDGFRSRLDSLNLEIKKKENIEKCIKELDKLQHFFDEYLFGMLSVMEKQVMTRIYHDFNTLFVDWFDKLIDNENLKVRLDGEFTPVITQNGYDIPYGYLSGGEKTACALAYRLALNQVINNLMSRVKTKDLLILDEPTDGFSSEQLDRMRLVLDELDVGQLIIVSHEAKIESFVEKVIRFEKKDHVSKRVR